MKASVVLALAAAAVASAVDTCSLSSIPSCALRAIQSAVASNTKCAADDFPCVCSSQQAVTGAATSTVLKDCGEDVAISELSLLYNMSS